MANLLSDIKNAAIKMLGMDDDATETEVHDALLQAGESTDGLRTAVSSKIQNAISTEFSGQIESLTTQITDLTTKLADLETKLSAVAEAAISSDVVEALAGRVTANEGSIQSCTDISTEQANTIKSLSGEIAAVKAAAGVQTGKPADPNSTSPATPKAGASSVFEVETPELKSLVMPKLAGSN